jgi:hypothetical protein
MFYASLLGIILHNLNTFIDFLAGVSLFTNGVSHFAWIAMFQLTSIDRAG